MMIDVDHCNHDLCNTTLLITGATLLFSLSLLLFLPQNVLFLGPGGSCFVSEGRILINFHITLSRSTNAPHHPPPPTPLLMLIFRAATLNPKPTVVHVRTFTTMSVDGCHFGGFCGGRRHYTVIIRGKNRE